MYVYLKSDSFQEKMARNNLISGDTSKVLGISNGYLSMLKSPQKYGLSPSAKLRSRMMRLLRCKFDDLFFIQNARYVGQYEESRPEYRANG